MGIHDDRLNPRLSLPRLDTGLGGSNEGQGLKPQLAKSAPAGYWAAAAGAGLRQPEGSQELLRSPFRADDSPLQAVHSSRGLAKTRSSSSSQRNVEAGLLNDAEADVEKGLPFHEHSVDFLGGFSLNSSFDPQKDV